MSYTKLWNNTGLVFKQSAEHRAIFENFITAVNNRILVEESYSSDLRHLASELEKHLNKQNGNQNSMILVLSAMKLDLVRRSTQTTTFANHLRDDILTILQDFLGKQLIEAVQMEKKILNLESTYQQQSSKVRGAKAKVSEIDKTREQEFIKLEIMKARVFLNKEQQQKQQSKVRKVEKQYQDFLTTAKGAIRQYNQFVREFYPQLEKSLNLFQKQQEDRINMMVDNMKKFLVFEVSVIRNFEYDVANVTNYLETIQVKKDIQEFVNKHTKEAPKYAPESLSKLSLTHSVIVEMLNKGLDHKIKFNKNEGIVGAIAKIHKNELIEGEKSTIGQSYEDFAQLSKIVFQAKSDGLSQAHKQKLNQLLEKAENRNYLQLCLRMHIEQDGHSTSQTMPPLVSFFLENCLSNRDVFCLRAVLKTIFGQLSSKSMKNKQKLLYGQLINLPLWKNNNFWDACVFQSVQQKLKTNHYKHGEKIQEEKARQKNIIFTQLADCLRMMVMLGHSPAKTKEIALKYCRAYNVSQSDNLNLMKVIGEGLVSYREWWVLPETGTQGSKESK